MKQTGNPEGLYIVELRVREGDLVGYMAEYCIGGDWYSAAAACPILACATAFSDAAAASGVPHGH